MLLAYSPVAIALAILSAALAASGLIGVAGFAPWLAALLGAGAGAAGLGLWGAARPRDVDALEGSEARAALLESMAEAAQVGAWHRDLVSGRAIWSRQTRRIFEVDDAFDPSFGAGLAFYRPEALETLHDQFRQALAAEQPFAFEAPIVTARGRSAWVRVVGTVERDGARPVGMFGAITDITAARAAAERQAFADRMNRHIADMHAAYFAGSPKSAFERALRALQELIGGDHAALAELAPGEGPPRDRLIVHAATAAQADQTGLAPFDEAIASCLETGAAAHCAAPDAQFVAPIQVFGEAVGLVALGGRPEGYDGDVRYAIEPLLEALANLIVSHQDREARRATEAALAQALKKADQALADLSAYQAALDQQTIVAITDAKGDILVVNDRFCEISGYSREELLGQNHRILNSGVHPKKMFVEMWRAIGSGKSWRGEICNRRKNGDLYWVDTTIVPMFGDDGRPERFVSVRYDITERVNFAGALERESARLKTTLEATDAAPWEVCFSTGKVILCDRWLARLGVQSDDGQVLAQTWHPDDEEIISAALRRHLAGESAMFEAEFRVRAADGEYIWVESRGKVVSRDANGKPLEMFGTHTEITRRKESDLRLKEALLQIAGFFDVSLDLLCVASLDGRFLRVNRAFETTLGYPVDVLEGRSFLDLVHPDDLEPTLACLSGMADGQTILNFVNRYRCADGSWRHIEWRSAPKGGVVYAAARDITERLAYEAELTVARDRAQAAATSKSTFLANMSHEIRTPLNGIVGLAGALAATPLNPQQQEMADLIKASGDTLERLLTDILDMSKIEAGKLSLHVEPFDLKEAIEIAAQVMRVRADDKGLRFLVRYSDTARGSFFGDGVRLRQIVSNLTSNAVKFTHAGQVMIEVDVRETDAASDVVIAVSDTGVGFDAETAERLFGRFEQADQSTTRTFGGSGLGLSICKSLCDLMGGEISAVSSPGVGSRFTVVLPLDRTMPLEDYDRQRATEAEAALAPSAVVAESSAPVRILLAEDHPTNQRVVSLILGPLGVDLTIVANGEQALAAFANGGFDLVLMDMQMPVMDGLAATRAIRALERREGRGRTPIAMLSANAMQEHVDHAMAAGCDLHIAKPVTPQALIEGVEHALSLAVAPLREAG